MAGMELVVLGSSASCPAAGDACSGYLVRQGATQLLVDCGSGVLGKLFQHTRIEDVTAILISHFHPDHFLDLVTLRYGLRYGQAGAPKPRLLLPPAGIGYLRQVGMALRGTQDYFTGNYEVEEYNPAASLRLGDLTVDFERTAHDIPTWSMAFEGEGRLVYSSDTSPCPALEDFATAADLFLCESTYPADPDGITTYNHLRSVEAAAMAQRANVGRLVLTHFWAGFPRERFGREAEQVLGKPVELAASGRSFDVFPSDLGTPAGVDAFPGSR